MRARTSRFVTLTWKLAKASRILGKPSTGDALRRIWNGALDLPCRLVNGDCWVGLGRYSDRYAPEEREAGGPKGGRARPSVCAAMGMAGAAAHENRAVASDLSD